MGLHPCGILAKAFLVFINIIYILVGLLLVGAGIVFLVEKDDFQVLTGDNNLVIGIGLMAAGIFSILIAVLGIMSSLGEMAPLLVVYAFLSVGMIGLEITAATVCYVERTHITTNADRKFRDYIKKYRNTSSVDYNSKVNEVIDFAQSRLKCCGLASYDDWIAYNPQYILSDWFPGSCECTEGKRNCIHLNISIVGNIINPTTAVWNRGCNETFYGLIGSNFTTIGASGIVIALVQILTVIFAISLCLCILSAKSNERRIARIRAAAYTPLESYSNHEDEHKPSAGTGEPYTVRDRTISNDIEPNDNVPTEDHRVYIK